MAIPVRWTLKAGQSFDRIIEYLENEWTEREVKKFIDKTFSTITIISAFPNIYVEDRMKNIRKAFVTEQVSMIYRTFDNHIDILYFWDNTVIGIIGRIPIRCEPDLASRRQLFYRMEMEDARTAC